MSGPGDGIRIRCALDPGHSFDTVFRIEDVREGKRSVGRLTFTELGPNEYAGDALFSVSETGCQRLADDLWAAGYRPRGAAGSAGQLDAVQAHLADMQEIAKGFLSGKTRLGGLDDATREMLSHREAEVRAVRTAYECERNTSERWVNAVKSLEKQLAQAEQAGSERAARSLREVEKTYQAEVNRLREEMMASRQKLLAAVPAEGLPPREPVLEVANALLAAREPRE